MTIAEQEAAVLAKYADLKTTYGENTELNQAQLDEVCDQVCETVDVTNPNGPYHPPTNRP